MTMIHCVREIINFQQNSLHIHMISNIFYKIMTLKHDNIMI